MTKQIKLFALFVVLILSNLAMAQQQEKANYRLAERFSPEKIKKMVFDTSVRPNWLKQGDKFWYKYKTSQGTSYYIVDMNKKTKKNLFDNHKMATMLTKITKDPYDYKHLPNFKIKFKKKDKVFQFDVKSNFYEKQEEKENDEEVKEEKEIEKEEKLDTIKSDTIKKPLKKNKYKKKTFHLEYNIATGKLYEIKDWKEEIKNTRWASISPDGKRVVFARDYNLFWMDQDNYEKAKKNAFDIKEDKKTKIDTTIVENQLTFDGIKDFSYGGGYTIDENDNYEDQKIKEEQEKRRRSRIVWTKDSKKIFVSKRDSRDVKNLWVIDVTSGKRPKLETYKYHLPGEEDNYLSEMWVFDFVNKEGVKINSERFKQQKQGVETQKVSNKQWLEDYVATTSISDSSDKMYFTRLSRDMHREDLCVADTNTGEVTVLVEQRMNTYIDSRDLNLLSNGQMIRWSEEDGWAHLYRYNSQGKLINQITKGAWHCDRILDIDQANKVIYFTANAREKGEDPYYSHVYRVNFNGTGLRLLNKGDFDNRAYMSDSKKYFINNFSRVNTTPESVIIDNTGKKVLSLEKADLSNLFASGYKFPEPFTIKAADGITDLYGVMYKPFDFDESKQYPIIEYVYPGPQTEAVNKSFSARMNRLDRTAQLGFIVVSLGNRGGHPARSKWYHNYGYGDLRDYGLADKKYAVEQLADRYSFIDIDRVGITGHSGGGFMSTAALCQYPDFYSVAVSSAGNHDNNIYNSWWSEKHHGIREIIENEESTKFVYEIENNQELAGNLKGKLLLVTGDIDNNVHPGNTIRMANALIKAKKRFDFFMMPGQRHGFGDYTEYFFWLKADYFCKNLIGDYSISTDIFEMRRENKLIKSKKR
ncbi:MAG: S9 family peptidase [Flavobacteriaceae bacterium]|nr:S9 family peptidase [Flavobacteriaceae bacterium]